MATTTPKAGLEGIIAGSTDICSVEQGGLIYRGYEIADLAENATFEEVAYLLLEGHKPSVSELANFERELKSQRNLPQPVIDFLLSTPSMLQSGSAVPMDIVRTAVSLLGNLDPNSQDISPKAELHKARTLTAQIPTIIGHMQNALEGRDLIKPDPNLSHAANLLYMMTGERPTAQAARVMDVSLILYAEHDYNASTFSARVICATLSDLHSAITGAIGALKGPLHGGANEAAMEMLKEIREAVHNGDTVEDWMRRAFNEKRKLMGFGHRVYKNGDHRAGILHALGRELAEQKGTEWVELFELGERVEKFMLDEKNIHPNVDFPCGMTYFTMDIPVPQYTPIFVAARVTGWAAHVLEQHANNRLIRPIAEYNGPALTKWNS
jgi:2-methylcitrate synthase/citrate synthase II